MGGILLLGVCGALIAAVALYAIWRHERATRPSPRPPKGRRATVTYVDEAHTMIEADVDELLAVLRDNSTRLPESRDAARQRHRKVLDDINANPHRRLRDPSPYAEGGIIPPRRFGDKQPIVLSEGRFITDPDEMEALGLTADARRARLDRWTDPHDSSSTTPPNEGDSTP